MIQLDNEMKELKSEFFGRKVLSEAEIETVAARLIRKYKLWGWYFNWNNRKRAMGTCNWAKKEISMSRPFFKLRQRDESLDTLIHEFAHAIAGDYLGHYNHGAKWKQVCLKLGCRPQRCGKGAPIKGRFEARVNDTGEVIHYRHRFSDNLIYSFRTKSGKRGLWYDTKAGGYVKDLIRTESYSHWY